MKEKITIEIKIPKKIHYEINNFFSLRKIYFNDIKKY